MSFSNSKNQTFVWHNGTSRFILHDYGTKTQQTTNSVDTPFKTFEIALVLMFVFGLIGNVLSILVMRSKRMRNTNASTFIILISILDSLFLFCRNIAMFYKKYDWYRLDNTCLITNSMTVVAQVRCLIKLFLKLSSFSLIKIWLGRKREYGSTLRR